MVCNEDDNDNCEKPENNSLAAISAHASWGCFDCHEPFHKGIQSISFDWKINSARQRRFSFTAT